MGVLSDEQLLIAEVKTRTPFDRNWKPAESWEERFEIANEYGDWIAIHTSEPWGGSFRLLEAVRNRTDKLILAKGFHDTDELVKKAFDHGADRVLRVGSEIPDEEYADRCLMEPPTIYHLRELTARGVRWAVWNSRDPSNGDTKVDGFDLARLTRPDGLLCQASNIVTTADVHPGADAVLVGTHLPEFVQSLD